MTAPQHVHFVGIGGIHMSAVAAILLADGVRVSGSDLTAGHLVEALRAEGAQINIGHDAAHGAGADLVVRSFAVPDDNPEVLAAKRGGVEVLTRAQMVARIAVPRSALTVAGSHGKSTSATMLTLILREAGLDPTYILGAECADLEQHGARGRGPHIVLEADEYGRAFHEYRPGVAVITNVERDHLDYYGTDAALTDAFLHYAQTLTPRGSLIVGAESPCAVRVADRAAADRSDVKVQSFGLGPDRDWGALDLQEQTEATVFRPVHEEEELGVIRLRVPGAYNVRNALAAMAAAHEVGAGFAAAQQALEHFGGVRRRFELQGEARGIAVVDDYAHHPTEIAATLAAARSRYPGRRRVVLFQPHTYSRSSYLLADFRRCFHDADALFVTDTYAAREEPGAGLTAADLAAQIDDPQAIHAGSLGEAVTQVAKALRAGDLLITMGAGDVEKTGPQVLARLEAS